MSIAEMTEHVQFTVDQRGHVTGVVVQPGLWRQIIEALEKGSDQVLIEALRTHGLTDPDTVDTLDHVGGHRSIHFAYDVDQKFDEAYATMLASEAVLRREWDTPEEDAAWANL